MLLVNVLQDFIANAVDVWFYFLSFKNVLLFRVVHGDFGHSVDALVYVFLQVAAFLTNDALLKLIYQTLQLIPILGFPLGFLAKRFPDKKSLRSIF